MAISRDIECANSNGGNPELYLFPFVKYGRSEIKYTDNYITMFPYSVIYKLESPITTFNENIEEIAGGVEFGQNLTYQLNKILDTDDYSSLAKADFRAITKDNNGFYRMIGTHNGLITKYTKETGGNRPDYNGFKFTSEGKEERTAGYLENLNGFDINGELTLNEILDTIL